MSALREIWEEISGLAQRKREAMEILHIAAGRIREVADEQHATYSAGMRMAADLIDPEVKK